eukprot:TRINITY_DN655_c0_g1_i1.p1 TRINITY_DN655_c0_g1~~TRINITY_DN655_c0_g1_i1.p1  ORF type:complete len:304 (+),score=50.64 TRINITY_DN655_c0_g1_i1:117-1028(+)
MEHINNAEWNQLSLSRLAMVLGVTSTLENVIYHPWWVLKTREQVEIATNSKSVWNNSISLASSIWKKEGIRSLYRGFWPGTLGSLPAGYVYIVAYHKSKYDLSHSSSPLVRNVAPFVAGIVAESASLGLFVPVDVITQRMQLSINTGKNCFEVAHNVIQTEGLSGFYRGTLLTAFKLGIASGVWWLSYESIKMALNRKHKNKNKQSSGIIPGFIAGVLSTIVTNPLDVIKTRIQTQVHFGGGEGGAGKYLRSGIMEGVKAIWLKEGWSGLNRGLIPKLVSQGPLSALWGVIYEFVMRYSTVKH